MRVGTKRNECKIGTTRDETNYNHKESQRSLHGAQRGASERRLTMAEDIPRLRAMRAGNRSVVTKLTNEVAAIFEQPELDAKTRDRLQRIDTILTQKMDLLDQLNDQIIAVCKVEEIEKEIGDAEDLKRTSLRKQHPLLSLQRTQVKRHRHPLRNEEIIVRRIQDQIKRRYKRNYSRSRCPNSTAKSPTG